VPLNNSPVEIATFLRCPDDGSIVRFERTELQCSLCSRRFAIWGNNIIEMLPTRPFQLSKHASAAYTRGYLENFRKRFFEDANALAWGSEETVSDSWIRKRLRQVRKVEPILKEGSNPEHVLCDVAAGAGHYTLAYAAQFRFVFHCDLSVPNLNYVRRRARQLGIRNIVLVRCDYFSLPFRQTMDRVICLDTLIRGKEHDSTLLQAICRTLAPSGRAVVDFHNWCHNPLRRLGLLPDNFHHNRSYTRFQADKLLRSIGLEDFSYFPFVQETDDTSMGKLLAHLLPSTRLMYRFEANAGLSSERAVDQLVARET